MPIDGGCEWPRVPASCWKRQISRQEARAGGDPGAWREREPRGRPNPLSARAEDVQQSRRWAGRLWGTGGPRLVPGRPRGSPTAARTARGPRPAPAVPAPRVWSGPQRFWCWTSTNHTWTITQAERRAERGLSGGKTEREAAEERTKPEGAAAGPRAATGGRFGLFCEGAQTLFRDTVNKHTLLKLGYVAPKRKRKHSKTQGSCRRATAFGRRGRGRPEPQSDVITACVERAALPVIHLQSSTSSIS